MKKILVKKKTINVPVQKIDLENKKSLDPPPNKKKIIMIRSDYNLRK